MIIKNNKELSRKVRVVNGAEKECQQILKIINGTEHEIWGGSSKVIPLGSGKIFDVSLIYPKYNELRTDNFFFTTADNIGWHGVSLGHDYWAPTGWWGKGASIKKTYDPSNGKLTFQLESTCDDRTFGGQSLLYANVNAYIILNTDKLIYLGEGQTFNISNLTNYGKYTEDNFIISNIKSNYAISSYTYPASISDYATFVKSYDPSNGVLNCYVETSSGKNNTFVYLNKRGV